MAQLMPLPLTVSCFSKIQIGFTFLVPAHLGSPGKGPLNGCVCVSVLMNNYSFIHLYRPLVLRMPLIFFVLNADNGWYDNALMSYIALWPVKYVGSCAQVCPPTVACFLCMFVVVRNCLHWYQLIPLQQWMRQHSTTLGPTTLTIY